jgi:hypothetical protein
MRRILAACAVVLGLLVPLAAVGTAHGDVAAFQSARNRQVQHFSISYQRVCPWCKEGEQAGGGIPPVASATAKYTLSSYKILDQNHRFDFYLVDVTATLVERKGHQDWGWMDTTVRSLGTTRVVSASYTLGKGVQNTTSCRTYPIDLGLSFYGVSAGTTAGHVSFCHQGSKIASSKVSGGRLYHSTGLTGISMIDAQRYVQVPQGQHPAFRIKVHTNHDSLQCPTLPDGTHCFVGHGMHGKHRTIGTTIQQ